MNCSLCKKCCFGTCLLFLFLIPILLQFALNPPESNDDLCNELTSKQLKPYHNLFKLSDGRTLEYFHFGDIKSKTYLLVVHGVMTDGSVSYRNNEIFKKLKLNVISPSIPGWGLSSPSKTESILDDANDYIELMDSLNINKFILCGWSAGGMYSLAISSLIPNRIIKLGLFVPVSMYYGKCNPWSTKFETNLRYFLGIKYIRDIMSMLTSNMITASFSDKYIKPSTMEQIIWNSAKRSFCKSWNGLNTMSKYIVSDWNDINFNKISKINKIMIVSNNNDTINIPPMQYCLHNLLDKSTLIKIPNKTHVDVMDQTEDLLNRILAF